MAALDRIVVGTALTSLGHGSGGQQEATSRAWGQTKSTAE